MPWVNYKAEALSVNSKAFIPEKRVLYVDLYVVSIVLPGLPDHADLTKSGFSHVGLSTHAHNNYYCAERFFSGL